MPHFRIMESNLSSDEDASSVDTAALKDRILGRNRNGLSGTKRKINKAFSSDSDESVLDTINRRRSKQQNLPTCQTKQSTLFHSSSEDSDNDASIRKKVRGVGANREVQSKEGEKDVGSRRGADDESSVDTAALMNRIKSGNGTQAGSYKSVRSITRQKSDSSLESSSSLLQPRLTNRFAPKEPEECLPDRSDENKPPNNHTREMESESVFHDDLSVVDDGASVDTVELTRRISNAQGKAAEFVLPDQSSSSEEEESVGEPQEQQEPLEEDYSQRRPMEIDVQTTRVADLPAKESVGEPQGQQEPLEDYSQRRPVETGVQTTRVTDLPPVNEQPPPKGPIVENPYRRKARVPVSSGVKPPRQDGSQTQNQPRTPPTTVFHDGLRKPQARFSSPKVAPIIKTPTGGVDDIQNSDDDGEVFGFGRTVTAAIERRKRDSITVNSWNQQSGPPLTDRFTPGYQPSETTNREEYETHVFPAAHQSNQHQNSTPSAEANEWRQGIEHRDNDFVHTAAAYDTNDHQRAPQPLVSSPQRQHLPETSYPNRFGSFAKADHKDSYNVADPGTGASDPQMEMDNIYSERIPNQLAYSGGGGNHRAYTYDDTQQYHDFERSSNAWEPSQPFAPQHPVDHPVQPFIHHNNPLFSNEQEGQFQQYDAGSFSINGQQTTEDPGFGETHPVNDFTLESSAHCELDFNRFQSAPMPVAHQQRAPRIRDAKSRKKIPRRGRFKQKGRKKRGGGPSARRRPAKGPTPAVHGDDPNLSGVGGAEITF